MTLIAGGREINIPVLPASLKVSSPGKNERTTVLELGEVLILRKKGLRTIEWDSRTPLRFLITGTDLDMNVKMGVESFEYEERSGELGDFYYSIKLYEWRDYSAKRITLPAQKSEPAKAQEPTRAGQPASKPKTYTVKSGDCLWNIAKALYGNGADYTKIYNANKGTIGKNPNLIYPGQTFTIP